MRRNLLIAVLALGTVLGFASGFGHLHHRFHRHHGGHAGPCCEAGHRTQGSPPPASP